MLIKANIKRIKNQTLVREIWNTYSQQGNYI